MSGRALARGGSSAPVVYYMQPGVGEIAVLTPAEVDARREKDRELYARWLVRRAEFAERDRRMRRFWAGFGAVLGLAVSAAVVLAGWLVYRQVGDWWLVALVPVGLVTLAGLAAGGHRCYIVVQHWH